jgi:hypothetical protein
VKVVTAKTNYMSFSQEIIEFFFNHYPELVDKIGDETLKLLSTLKKDSYFTEEECNIFHWPKINGLYYLCKADSDDAKCRSDKRLVEAVESTKDDRYTIVEIPDGVDYYISHGSGGDECIHEKHRVWR